MSIRPLPRPRAPRAMPVDDRPQWTARERELFTETDTTRPVDFHSTRRAYATALARANVNAQTAQVLSGHSDAKVHQRYVAAATITALLEAAAPDLSESTLKRQWHCLLPLAATVAPAPQKSKALVFTKAFSVGARRFDPSWPQSSLLDGG